jgi:hypothetical protein
MKAKEKSQCKKINLPAYMKLLLLSVTELSPSSLSLLSSYFHQQNWSSDQSRPFAVTSLLKTLQKSDPSFRGSSFAFVPMMAIGSSLPEYVCVGL